MLSPKLTLSLLATSALVLLVNPLLAQTPTEKLTVAAPVANPAAKADPDMAMVLNALAELGPKPIETLTPSEARKQYSATDAVKKVIKDEKLTVDPHEGLSISNSRFADMGNLRLRF
jgi:acetyl esterase